MFLMKSLPQVLHQTRLARLSSKTTAKTAGKAERINVNGPAQVSDTYTHEDSVNTVRKDDARHEPENSRMELP